MTEPLDEDPIRAWATTEAQRLHHLASDDAAASTEITAARAFLLRYGGPDFVTPLDAVRTTGSGWTLCRAASAALDSWLIYDAAFRGPSDPAVQFRREAATDLLEQVQVLLDDSSVHPAVPVMVGGAALEEFLRSLYIATAEPPEIAGVPSITKYGEALRKVDAVDRHAMHVINNMGATRNLAAHGHFDQINRDTAQLFVQQVNLFIAQHSA